MKKLDKYITSRNVAILGTVTAHMILFALFTHFSLETDLDREKSELVINFVETEAKIEEEEIQEEQNTPDTKVNIFEEFSKPLTNQASNQSSQEKVEELRASMKSIDENSDSDDKDLFSDEALKRDLKIEKESESNLGKNEEISTKTSYTGKSTINYSLNDRYSVKLPNPIYTCIESGLIYVDIKVDKAGNVIDVSYNKSRSTSSNECLIETSLKYAKMARFNSDYKNAPSTQKGYISYLFPKN